MRFEDRFDDDGNALPCKVIVRRARRQRAAERRAFMRFQRNEARRDSAKAAASAAATVWLKEQEDAQRKGANVGS